MSKVTLLLSIIFFLLVCTFFFFQSTYSMKSLPTMQLLKGKPTPVTQDTLYLSPNPKYVNIGKKTSINVTVNSEGSIPTLIQLEIAYDPTILANVTLTPGDFYKDPVVPLNNIDQTTGRISYAISSSSQSINKDAKTVAVVNFTPLVQTSKPTTLYFMPKTFIVTDDKKNALKIGFGAQIIVR